MKATHAEIKRLMALPALQRIELLETYKDHPGAYERLIEKAREVESDPEAMLKDESKDQIAEVIGDLILFEAVQRLPAGSVETYFFT